MGGYNFPAADFAPQLAGYTGQGAFRFWCQKVLPLVYDDSLSYYELLNKVVVYLNNTIKDVANVEDNVGKLATSYGELEGYVNEHFTELTSAIKALTETVITGTTYFVVPEMFGAYGDGVHDDTDAIETAILSGYLVYFPQTYLVTRVVDIRNAGDIVLVGGNFIFNNGGTTDFLSFVNCKSVSVFGANVACTDGGFAEPGSGGTFIATLYTPLVNIQNCKCENIYMLYRANYVLTNDNTQYFMDNTTIDNIICKDCVCPFEVSFCRTVEIKNITSFSSGIQRELVYIIGGINNIECNNIWCEANVRFAFHFNNNAVNLTPDNSIRHNWVEHFSLSDSTFNKCGARSIVDPMCPVGIITINNVVGLDPIYRCYPANNNSCIVEKIYVNNSFVGGPNLDGVSHGGNIIEVVFNNCDIDGFFSVGATDHHTKASFIDCSFTLDAPPPNGWVVCRGDFIFSSCRFYSAYRSASLNVLYVSDPTSTLHLADCEFFVDNINRIVMNTNNSQRLTLLNNLCYAITYGLFNNIAPLEGTIKGNKINLTDVVDVDNKISVIAVNLNYTTRTMSVGDDFDLIPELSPSNASNRDCSFNNSTPATVGVTKVIIGDNVAFKITALATGTSNVIIRSKENPSLFNTCVVTVV